MTDDNGIATPISTEKTSVDGEPPLHGQPEAVSEDAPQPTAPPTRRAATKRSNKARKPAKKSVAASRNAAAARQAKFPRHSVEKSLRVAQAIFDQNAGKPTSTEDAAKYTTGGKPNGPFNVEVSSGKKYGFLKATAERSFRRSAHDESCFHKPTPIGLRV